MKHSSDTLIMINSRLFILILLFTTYSSVLGNSKKRKINNSVHIELNSEILMLEEDFHASDLDCDDVLPPPQKSVSNDFLQEKSILEIGAEYFNISIRNPDGILATRGDSLLNCIILECAIESRFICNRGVLSGYKTKYGCNAFLFKRSKELFETPENSEFISNYNVHDLGDRVEQTICMLYDNEGYQSAVEFVRAFCNYEI